jgi:FkbM family methyltransferase
MLPGPENLLYENCWTLQQVIYAREKPDIILDIGANDGGYTTSFRQNGAKVIAFEPVPSMIEQFKAKHASDPGVTIFEIGLSDKAGICKGVQVLCAWTLGHAIETGLTLAEASKSQPPFDLRLASLDELNCIPEETKSLYVKLDVDGYEPRVFRGMKDTIARWRPCFVCELSGYPEKLGESIHAFARDILATGYVIVSNGGSKVISGEQEALLYWPYESSFDVMLIPREKLPLLL